MSKLVPRYTLWEAVGTAIALGLRALEEIRSIDRTPGAEGKPGRDGAPGKLPPVRAWSDGVCHAGDVRSHDGATWQAIRDTGKEPTAGAGQGDWIMIAGRGEDGLPGTDGSDGKSFRIRGTWLEINDYQALDVVALGGASFAARRDDPGPCPGDGWQLIAAQGKRGEPGKRGPAGDRGPIGPAVVSMIVSDEGMLTLERSDGSAVTCDLYPLLAKVAR